jgi:cytochrome c peroxidase
VRSLPQVKESPGQGRTRGLVLVLIAASAGISAQVSAHSGLVPPSLKQIKVPPVPGLLDGPQPIVVNREKAIVLGKALFWDMNVGSDDMACASCHFHAGADSRSRNQFSPGKTHLPVHPTDANAYDPSDPRGAHLANYQLKKSDFPLYKFDGSTGKLRDDLYTYNAVASSGTFSGEFKSVSPTGSGKDQCEPLVGERLDQTFNVNGIHTRRVEPRNSPTVINAVLFDRLFWDGRANHFFNGVSAFGPRDPKAFVWVRENDAVWKQRLALPNSAFASLSVGPPVNEFEMSCRGRTWPDIGRKLLKRRPLERQHVHPQDSALGKYRHASGKGLNRTYETLVREAFAPRFWSAGAHPLFGKPPYGAKGFTQAEANFSMFFGIALQLYAGTLISDNTPFDRSFIAQEGNRFVDVNGVLSKLQLEGFTVFNDAHCIFCHTGPLFSSATSRVTYHRDGSAERRTMVKRVRSADGKMRVSDAGYLNNGAVPSEADPGLAGVDDYGNALGFAPQYLARLARRNDQIIEPLPLVRACDIGFNTQNLNDLFTPQEFGAANLIPDPAGSAGCNRPQYAKVPAPDVVAAALDDADDEKLAPHGAMFKAPQLYNILLTGPYMHNGGMSTLNQVFDQYMVRAGNFAPGNSPTHANHETDTSFIFQFDDSPRNRQALTAFLQSLTDERVRYERAPFDHPQLFVPNGHPGDEKSVTATSGNGLAKDRVLVVPAVGKNGREVPLKRFDELLPD